MKGYCFLLIIESFLIACYAGDSPVSYFSDRFAITNCGSQTCSDGKSQGSATISISVNCSETTDNLTPYRVLRAGYDQGCSAGWSACRTGETSSSVLYERGPFLKIYEPCKLTLSKSAIPGRETSCATAHNFVSSPTQSSSGTIMYYWPKNWVPPRSPTDCGWQIIVGKAKVDFNLQNPMSSAHILGLGTVLQLDDSDKLWQDIAAEFHLGGWTFERSTKLCLGERCDPGRMSRVFFGDTTYIFFIQQIARPQIPTNFDKCSCPIGYKYTQTGWRQWCAPPVDPGDEYLSAEQPSDAALLRPISSTWLDSAMGVCFPREFPSGPASAWVDLISAADDQIRTTIITIPGASTMTQTAIEQAVSSSNPGEVYTATVPRAPFSPDPPSAATSLADIQQFLLLNIPTQSGQSFFSAQPTWVRLPTGKVLITFQSPVKHFSCGDGNRTEGVVFTVQPPVQCTWKSDEVIHPGRLRIDGPPVIKRGHYSTPKWTMLVVNAVFAFLGMILILIVVSFIYKYFQYRRAILIAKAVVPTSVLASLVNVPVRVDDSALAALKEVNPRAESIAKLRASSLVRASREHELAKMKTTEDKEIEMIEPSSPESKALVSNRDKQRRAKWSHATKSFYKTLTLNLPEFAPTLCALYWLGLLDGALALPPIGETLRQTSPDSVSDAMSDAARVLWYFFIFCVAASTCFVLMCLAKYGGWQGFCCFKEKIPKIDATVLVKLVMITLLNPLTLVSGQTPRPSSTGFPTPSPSLKGISPPSVVPTPTPTPLRFTTTPAPQPITQTPSTVAPVQTPRPNKGVNETNTTHRCPGSCRLDREDRWWLKKIIAEKKNIGTPIPQSSPPPTQALATACSATIALALTGLGGSVSPVTLALLISLNFAPSMAAVTFGQLSTSGAIMEFPGGSGTQQLIVGSDVENSQWTVVVSTEVEVPVTASYATCANHEKTSRSCAVCEHMDSGILDGWACAPGNVLADMSPSFASTVSLQISPTCVGAFLKGAGGAICGYAFYAPDVGGNGSPASTPLCPASQNAPHYDDACSVKKRTWSCDVFSSCTEDNWLSSLSYYDAFTCSTLDTLVLNPTSDAVVRVRVEVCPMDSQCQVVTFSPGSLTASVTTDRANLTITLTSPLSTSAVEVDAFVYSLSSTTASSLTCTKSSLLSPAGFPSFNTFGTFQYSAKQFGQTPWLTPIGPPNPALSPQTQCSTFSNADNMLYTTTAGTWKGIVTPLLTSLPPIPNSYGCSGISGGRFNWTNTSGVISGTVSSQVPQALATSIQIVSKDIIPRFLAQPPCSAKAVPTTVGGKWTLDSSELAVTWTGVGPGQLCFSRVEDGIAFSLDTCYACDQGAALVPISFKQSPDSSVFKMEVCDLPSSYSIRTCYDIAAPVSVITPPTLPEQDEISEIEKLAEHSHTSTAEDSDSGGFKPSFDWFGMGWLNSAFSGFSGDLSLIPHVIVLFVTLMILGLVGYSLTSLWHFMLSRMKKKKVEQ